VVPHDGAPSSRQSSRGSEPASAGTHVPSRPAPAQVKQTPEQALSQQIPSEQNPVSHWLPAVQPWPVGTDPVSRAGASRSPPVSLPSPPASGPSMERGTSAPPSVGRLSLLKSYEQLPATRQRAISARIAKAERNRAVG